jgi:hypothetical protein
MTVIVLTVDQRGSRSTPDRVADVVTALADLPLRLPFERTAGDEFQGVLDEPSALPRAIERLLRDGAWYIGLGIGEEDEPEPDTARAGRGPAYVLARHALTAAKNSPWHLRVSGDADTDAARDLESVLWLWAAVLDRRSDKGWEVTDLVDQGLSYDEAGRRLGISQSAVSQRAQAAGLVEGRRAREVVTHLAARLLGKDA